MSGNNVNNPSVEKTTNIDDTQRVLIKRNVQHLLQCIQSNKNRELDGIDKELCDMLMEKENGYTIKDLVWLSTKIVERNSIKPLLEIAMDHRQDLSIETLSMMYKHLDEIKDGTEKLDPPKGLTPRQEPRYELLSVLLQWRNNTLIAYENISIGLYKYLPSQIQGSIYENLESRKSLRGSIPSAKAKYLQICLILGKDSQRE